MDSVGSALSSLMKPFHGIFGGKYSLVSRFLRGFFNIRPALPQYVSTWNISKVVQYLKIQKALLSCDLKAVLHRLAILLILTTRQRDQTIKFLNLECLKVFDDRVILFIPDKLKTTRPGHHLPPLELKAHTDVELRVVSYLRQYINLTENLKKSDDKQFLLVKPHKLISTSALSRWCVRIIKDSGVGIQQGKHQHQSVRQQDFHLERYQNRQGGQLKILSHYIMTSQLRKIFLRFFFCSFVEFGNIYVACNAFKYYNNRNLFLYSYSQFRIYTKRTGSKWERIDKLN